MSSSTGKRWWSLGPPQRREDYSRWEGYEVDPRTAVKGLWRALETGEIVATGISKCEGVRRVAFGCIAEGHGRKMHPNRDKVNVLLVDDQPSKLLSYEVILEELGENLIKAASGKEALAQLLRREIAVILVDVAMPELDGFELAAMICEHPRFEQTAIIFVSAVHLSEFDSLRGYQAGAVDYLQSRLFRTSCAPRFAFSVTCTGRPDSWKRLTRSWRGEWKPARRSLRQQMRTWKSGRRPDARAGRGVGASRGDAKARKPWTAHRRGGA